MKKIFLSLVIILVVVIVAGGIAASFFLGPIIKTGIETVGPKITQVSIKMDAMNLSLLTGSAGIKNLVVGNPEGYQAPQAIRVGSIAVGVNPLSVLSDKMVIRSIRIEAPEITFEGNPFSENNLNTIMKNVNAAARSGGPAATNTAAKGAPKPAQKLQVDELLITGAKVNFNGIVLSLPDIPLANLGKGPDGITPAELTRQVLDALTRNTKKAVAGTFTGLGKNVEKTGKDLGKSLGSNVSNLGKDLGNLLKKSTN
jgi:uncharacterized protein involved in outer membrane biogenesis